MSRIIANTIAAGVNFSATAWDSRFAGMEWEMLLFLPGVAADPFVATRDSARHAWNVPGTVTTDWPAGEVDYTIRATNGVDTHEVESGRVRIFGDVAKGASTRTPNRIALDAIEAVIAKRATLDQQRYRINNRELYRESVESLLKLRGHYLRLCSREEGRSKGPRELRQIKTYMRPMGS